MVDETDKVDPHKLSIHGEQLKIYYVFIFNPIIFSIFIIYYHLVIKHCYGLEKLAFISAIVAYDFSCLDIYVKTNDFAVKIRGKICHDFLEWNYFVVTKHARRDSVLYF